MRHLALLLLLAACNGSDSKDGDPPTDNTDTQTTDTDTTGGDDTDTTGGDDTDSGGGTDDWCGVQTLIGENCLVCHSAVARLGDLDLETDPYTALVNVTAAGDAGATLVVPGDSAASALYQKMAGTASFGDVMPPTGALDAASLAIVAAWIDGGASDQCGTPDTDVTPAAYHPAGYDDPTVHGAEAKYQVQTCVQCHGNDLTGSGDIPSCDTCHEAGWRTNCTYCHGEAADGTGAPPLHISGVDDGAAASFIPHRAHTDATDMHRAFDCTECHVKPTDVLSLGHLFLGDATPGEAEADFTASISQRGTWNGNGTCNNLWCHGNGQGDNGRMQHDGNANNCHACHSDWTSGFIAWNRMSGRHADHLGEGIDCWECHGATVDANNDIIGFDEHINRTADVQLRQGMNWNNGRCTGTCHGENHQSRSW